MNLGNNYLISKNTFLDYRISHDEYTKYFIVRRGTRFMRECTSLEEAVAYCDGNHHTSAGTPDPLPVEFVVSSRFDEYDNLKNNWSETIVSDYVR